VRLGIRSEEHAEAVDRWASRTHHHLDRSHDEYFVAKKLGLTRYQWFAYGYEMTSEDPSPDRIEIDLEGRVLRPLQTVDGPRTDQGAERRRGGQGFSIEASRHRRRRRKAREVRGAAAWYRSGSPSPGQPA
jgi:hypothetical protein